VTNDQNNAAANADPEAPAATSAPATSAPADKPADKPADEPADAPAAAPATYAGKVTGGAATIAISVKGDKAIAYLCDGNRTEAWLQGSARNGELVLRGAGNARLTGTYDETSAEGNVNASGRRFTFAVRAVKPPSGLYRASANVANAQIVEGWIVDGNGEVTGTMTRNGVTGEGATDVARVRRRSGLRSHRRFDAATAGAHPAAALRRRGEAAGPPRDRVGGRGRHRRVRAAA
jgi:hypothetical protein